MKPCDVEIFDRSFTLLSHTNVNEISYSEDYLSPVSNEVTVFNCLARKGDYIRIKKGDSEYFGVINSVMTQDARTMTICFGSFLEVFDTDVLFDTDLQGTSTIEAVMRDLISGLFVNNADASMNIAGLAVSTSSSTAGWGLNLKSDTEGKHHCIVNLYDTFIVRALEKYSVVCTVNVDVQAKAIALVIGKRPEDPQKIEADLPNILEKNIILKETDKDVNKLIVYNTADYSANRVYYRHSDDTYSTANSDRLTPVVQEIHGVDVDEGGTFASAANAEAAEVFGEIEYNNLIELVVKNDDTIVKPYSMRIGCVARIISKGEQYTSILTGKTTGDRTQLTFGTIRLDLTKIIKRRYANGY